MSKTAKLLTAHNGAANVDVAALLARVEAAEARAAAAEAKAQAPRKLSLKVSEKGGVSLYGVRRFPVTFYKSEWEAILSMADKIKAFMVERSGELSSKTDD